MTSLPTRSFCLISLCIVLMMVLVATSSWALECGDTIGPGEVVTLDEDINCPLTGPAFPALILESSSILNLGGYTIDCGTGLRTGIQMEGGGSVVKNGTVTRCENAVVVGGDGGHIVTKVTATDTFGSGVSVRSSNNEISYNRSLRNGLGYTASKNGNTFIANLAKDCRTAGFNVDGNNLILIKNRAIRNSGDGITVRFGSGLKMLHNTVKRNTRYGIELQEGAINSIVVRNVSKSNGISDLKDGNPNCDNNQWVGNRFKTADPADCIH